MKIRIESSSSNGPRATGVGYYSKRLTSALAHIPSITVTECQFDFLSRHTRHQLTSDARLETINFPQKIYAKLDYLYIAPPFDLTKETVDVTIFPNYALWPTVKSRKNVVTIHDLTYLHYPEVMEEKNLHYLRRTVPKSLKRADLVLTVSETVEKELIKYFNIDSNQVYVTPVPPTEEYSVSSTTDVRRIYGIETPNYILFASTIEPRKNLDVLLDAYTALPQRILDTFTLVVAGGMGWKSTAIKAKLENLQNRGYRIIVTGYYDQKNAPALFQQAALFVMPSLYEGFGMPLLEAMASRTATIASDIDVFREVCGEASLYFKPNDSTQLRDCIQKVVENDSVKNKLIAKGIKNLERYSWDSIAKGLTYRLEELLKS